MYPPLLGAAMLENPDNDTHVPGGGAKYIVPYSIHVVRG
jgi:hypothetical protein